MEHFFMAAFWQFNKGFRMQSSAPPFEGGAEPYKVGCIHADWLQAVVMSGNLRLPARQLYGVLQSWQGRVVSARHRLLVTVIAVRQRVPNFALTICRRPVKT